MRGTPEGRYFAGKTVLHYAVEECDNARKQIGQQKGLVAREMWLKGYMFDAISNQLSNITSVFARELPPKNYYTPNNHYIWLGSEGTGVDNLSGAIFEYTNQPAIDKSQLYVALRVTEEYVTDRITTPQALQTFRRDVKAATRREEPKYKLNPDLLRQGITFLREKVESVKYPKN